MNRQDFCTHGGGKLCTDSFIFHAFQLTYCPSCLFSVFWDLYCAAPERREQCDHSSEAKAFHDYVRNYSANTLIRDQSQWANFLFLSSLFQGFVSSGYGVNGIGGHVSSTIQYCFSIVVLSKYPTYMQFQNAGPAPSPIGQLPPNEGMPGGPMAPNFFPVSYFRRRSATNRSKGIR